MLLDLLSIIKEANKAIMDIYATDFEVFSKGENNPVTKADLEANLIICKGLIEINNKYNLNAVIISEENKEVPFDSRKNSELAWLVDPIDGTKEFLKKTGEFTVNIGLIQNGTPVFGIVSIPATGEIYFGGDQKWTGKEKGSYYLKQDKWHSIQVSSFFWNQSKLKIVCSASHMNQDTQNYVNKFENHELVRCGSSIKLLKIASGEADIYPRLGPTMEWDTCAAHAVVKYAGGKVLQHDTDNELVYNKENLLNPFFVCYGNDN